MRVVLTEDGPLDSLQAYLVSLGEPSMTAQRKICVAVGRLYDYYRASPPDHGHDPVAFMARFARALKRGTIQPDGDDPLDLFWPRASRKQQRAIIRIVTQFSDFCAKASGSAPLNPTREASFRERLVAYTQIAERRKYDLLAHLKPAAELQQRVEEARAIAPPRLRSGLRKEPPFFPFEHTMDMIERGFLVRRSGPDWARYNLRDLMIFVLQRFGGLRASEALQLFVRDVDAVRSPVRSTPGSLTSLVRLADPEDGITPYADPLTGKRVTDATRAQFLQAVHGRVPRTDPLTPPGQRLGWKSMLMEDLTLMQSEVHWFPEEWGEYFLRLYLQYLKHVLPRGLDHPYLFVVTKPGPDYGAPLSLEAYYDSLERAVARIGLVTSKDKGTSSHGLRHAYAQSLKRVGIGRKLRQVFLHHVSPLSQDAYTAPTSRELADALRDARARVEQAALPAHARTLLLPPMET